MDDIFNDLFLTKEEENIHKLQKLEKYFIKSPQEMLWLLEKEKIEALDNYNKIKAIFDNYKKKA